MTIFGVVLMAVGLALSPAAFVHDFRRLRTGRQHGGQLAGSRVAPEVHALAALLLGTGVGLVWGWRMGSLATVAHAAVAYLLIRPLIHR